MQFFRQPASLLLGRRTRMQRMNDAFEGCPSLLDSLVFYPAWVGSQCVDLISGAVLTNSASNVTSTVLGPNEEMVGTYVTGSSQYLNAGMSLVFGNKPFTVAVWIYPSASTTRDIISKYESTGNQREWAMRCGTVMDFAITADGTGSTISSTSDSYTIISGWNCVIARNHPDLSKISISNMPRPFAFAAAASGIFSGTASLRIGYTARSAYWDGYIGSSPIWMRVLSDEECRNFYSGAMGLKISEFLK